MKKFYSFLVAILCAFSVCLVGCKDKPESPVNRLVPNCPFLVLYFTRTNHTGEIADEIADEIDANIYRIMPEVEYSSNYKTAMKREAEDRATGVKPALKRALPSLQQYDIIFIGFPVWEDDIPNIIRTVAESADFEGKTVIPFCTHRGSGVGNSISTLRNIFTGLVGPAFDVSEDDVGTDKCERAIEVWLTEFNVYEWR